MKSDTDRNPYNDPSTQLVVKNTFLEFTPKGFNVGRRASAPITKPPFTNSRRCSNGKISTDGESQETEACSVLSSAETESVGVWADNMLSSEGNVLTSEGNWSDDVTPHAKISDQISGLPMMAVNTGDFQSHMEMETFPDEMGMLAMKPQMLESAYNQYYYAPPVIHPVGQLPETPVNLTMPPYQEMASGYNMVPEPLSPGVWHGYHEPLSPVSPGRNNQWGARQGLSPPSSPTRRKNQWIGAKSEVNEDQYTTVMLRNLPNDYTRGMLLELLESQGLNGKFDFFYLPFDFRKHAGLGYAFMNMVTHADAVQAMSSLTGFRDWRLKSNKVMQVTWSTPLQGLWANVERYKNSPVMHPDVPSEFKPLLLSDGVPIAFPPPTKPLQAPALNQ